MARLFLVVCDSGELESAQEHVVCAYLTRELAELHVEHCSAVAARFAPPLPSGNEYGDVVQKHWEVNEARYLEAMCELDPEACVVSFQHGEYRVEETRLLNEVPNPPRALP